MNRMTINRKILTSNDLPIKQDITIKVLYSKLIGGQPFS